MLWLAFRMLFQERGRLIITLVGIVFSTVLTLVEGGIYLGMMGFKVVINVHGEVLRVEQPSAPDDEGGE